MKLCLSFFILSLSYFGPAFAQKAGVTLGFSQVQIEGDSGTDISSNGSYQLGGLFYQPMTEMSEARVGALFGQQNLIFASGGNETTMNLSYVHVPLTLGFRFNERFLLFLGPVISLNASKSCKATTGECRMSQYKVKGTDVLLSLGGHVQLTESLGLEVTMDRINSKPFEGATGGQIININFQYLIE